jgi:hypothetical protein
LEVAVDRSLTSGGAAACAAHMKESASMDPTMIRVISGVMFVVIVFVIVARRKKMASKRKRIS